MEWDWTDSPHIKGSRTTFDGTNFHFVYIFRSIGRGLQNQTDMHQAPDMEVSVWWKFAPKGYMR